MKQKIVAKATERIDSEVRQRFSEVVDRLNQRVFDPLNSLALDPQLIDAQTTEKRFTMRLRLGGEDQLGSHTPRPPSLSDSLASLQIHESVINNGIQRLRLDGRTFTLPELSRHIAASLNCPAPWPTNSENDDVKITFAKQNSVVVRCQDGQVLLTLSIARLCKGTRYIWHNFQVQAIYQPVVHGRSAQLVREDVYPVDRQAEHRIADDPPRRLRPRAVEKNAVGTHAAADHQPAEAARRGGHAVRDRERLDRHFARPEADDDRPAGAVRNAMSAAI